MKLTNSSNNIQIRSEYLAALSLKRFWAKFLTLITNSTPSKRFQQTETLATWNMIVHFSSSFHYNAIHSFKFFFLKISKYLGEIFSKNPATILSHKPFIIHDTQSAKPTAGNSNPKQLLDPQNSLSPAKRIPHHFFMM